MRKLKFIDLFAGLGGFHLALAELGHKCVFASELNSELQKLYEKNHNIKIHGDITQVEINSIPKHDILCAGFPCQPFSKAGSRLGLDDPKNGNLFFKIVEILDMHKPEFLFLENVSNLKGHDNGNTWLVIKNELSKTYDVQEEILSPHHFGIPQHRSRIYIVGRLKSKGGLANFEFPKKYANPKSNIHDIIIHNDKTAIPINKDREFQLSVWQEFLDNLTTEEVPHFPIWAMEFGADYPFEEEAPIKLKKKHLEGKRGAFGQIIKGKNHEEMLKYLPSYAQNGLKDTELEFPTWKKNYIRLNREFYKKNKSWLDNWIVKIKKFETSHQKFEWNCGKEPLTITDKIVQFRPSGIRVKLPTYSPALVTTTQIPIFPWLGRYMTTREAAKLQCMENLKELPPTAPKAFRALGNAVNVGIVKLIATKLLQP